jgi:serine acetyltransferase/acyl carrier protein
MSAILTRVQMQSRSIGRAKTVDAPTVHAYGPSAWERWTSRRALRYVNRLGAGAQVKGSADIAGGGEIFIGDRFLLLSRPSRSHIFSEPGAVITIGDDVQISYGAAISAQRSIDIGCNTIMGPFVVIIDNDFHSVSDRNAAGEIAPVRIGKNVKVGARVTILRGSVIGDNVRIMSGSMVSGIVPDGVTVGGAPARIMDAGEPACRGFIEMPDLVQNVLGLAAPPHPGDGPAEIATWDSLGTLRLLLAIEETYGVNLDEGEMRAGNTVAALAALVAAKLSAESA